MTLQVLAAPAPAIRSGTPVTGSPAAPRLDSAAHARTARLSD